MNKGISIVMSIDCCFGAGTHARKNLKSGPAVAPARSLVAHFARQAFCSLERCIIQIAGGSIIAKLLHRYYVAIAGVELPVDQKSASESLRSGPVLVGRN